MIPRSLVIPLCYDPMGDPLSHGEFGDVWKGKHDGREVATNVPRVHQISDFKKVTKVRPSLIICINN